MPSHTASSPVKFFFTDQRFYFPARTVLKSNINTLVRKEGFRLESLNIVFCSDDYLLRINRDFLKHDFYTDIITFDYSEKGKLSGELYISIDRVRDNSRALSETFKREIHRVIFHGVLHLCGYKDKNKKDQTQMRIKEEQYLRLFHF